MGRLSSPWTKGKLLLKMRNKTIMRPHTIELMKPHTHPDTYINAVECYDGIKDIANYYQYTERETEENQLECGEHLYFVQLIDNRFSLVLSNQSWLTNDLQEIIVAMQRYNDPIEEPTKKTELSPAEINLMKGQLLNAIEDAITPIWSSLQTKFGVHGDIDIPLQCEYDDTMAKLINCIVQQISDELEFNNAN